MSRWSQITANSYGTKDSRVRINKSKNSKVDWGFVLGKMSEELLRQTANVAGAMLKNHHEIENRINTNVQNFMGSEQMQKLQVGIKQEHIEDFVLNAQNDYTKGQELINKNKRDSKEYLEGQRLINQAQTSVNNLVNNKQAINAKFELEKNKNVKNLDVTSNPGQVANTLSWQNGTFLTENRVYASYPSGELQYDHFVGEQVVVTEKEYQWFMSNAGKEGMPQWDDNLYVRSDFAIRGMDPDEAAETNNPYGYTEIGLNMLDAADGSSNRLVAIKNAKGEDMVDRNGNQRYRIRKYMPTNIMNAETAIENLQDQQGSLKDFLFDLKGRGGGLLARVNNSGWNSGFGGSQGGATGKGTAYASGPASEASNDIYINKIKTEIDNHFKDRNDQEIRSDILKGTTILRYEDGNGGTVDKEVSLIEPLLWNRGVQKFELSPDELAEAREIWKNKGEYVGNLTFGPGDEDDATISFKSEVEYDLYKQMYETNALALATNPHAIDDDDVELVKGLILDDALHVNKIAYKQGQKDKQNQMNEPTAGIRQRQIWRYNLKNDWSRDVLKSNPLQGGGYGVPDPQEQINFFNQKINDGLVIEHFPGDNDGPGYFGYLVDPTGGDIIKYKAGDPMVGTYDSKLERKIVVGDIKGFEGDWAEIPTENDVMQIWDKRTGRWNVPALVDFNNIDN